MSRSALDAVENRENQVFLSVASLWEIAVKLSTGKLRLNIPFMALAVTTPEAHGVEMLPIEIGHLDIVSRLPMHHRDPFDRLLVAQSLAEGIAIVSNDSTLDSYGIERLW